MKACMSVMPVYFSLKYITKYLEEFEFLLKVCQLYKLCISC